MTPEKEARLRELQQTLLPTMTRQLKALRLEQQALLKEERALRDEALAEHRAEASR